METEKNAIEKSYEEGEDSQPAPKEEKHPKQDFQVERLAFFSDAVFAIALTLLVVEFKAPHITSDSTFDDVVQQLFDLKYHFVAILLSFFAITNFWTSHHQLFKYIHNYNTSIIVANLLVLLPIIFFPFTTAFMAESLATIEGNFANPAIYLLGFKLFLINAFFAALASYILYWFVIVKYKELSFEMPKKEKIKFTFNSYFSIFILAAMAVVLFITHNILIITAVTYFALFIRIILRRKIVKSKKRARI